MTIPTFNAVGFCAHYSRAGDWAFDYALDLSRSRGLQLNVFHFLADPYDPDALPPRHLTRGELSTLSVEKERELRLYYDDRAGDYLEVGFRLCQDNEWVELHRCLIDQEFQLLVLGYPEPGATFGRWPLEVFAERFICPVVLVGPDHPRQIRCNSTAAMVADRLEVAPEPVPSSGVVAG